jgi:transcriptional regulator with XRE-family HTH domain
MDRRANGGALLRALRQDAGLTLIELAGLLDDASIRIDAAHLQRIETGRIVRPAAETIEAILKAGFDAPYRVRRDVLDAYGYRLPWELPDDRDIQETRRLLANEVSFATWPTYFMDYGLRIWGWNRYFPRLLGREPDDPYNEQFLGVTHIDIVLNPELGTFRQIANAADFAPLMLTMFKTESKPYRHEPWHRAFVERIRGWPGIGELWDGLPDDPDDLQPTRPVLPVEIVAPGIEPVMRFRITPITFLHDPRFQIMHLIPFGAATLRECANWAEAAGEP